MPHPILMERVTWEPGPQLKATDMNNLIDLTKCVNLRIILQHKLTQSQQLVKLVFEGARIRPSKATEAVVRFPAYLALWYSYNRLMIR